MSQERLNSCVSALMAMGPKCFKWMLVRLSGPGALEFFLN